MYDDTIPMAERQKTIIKLKNIAGAHRSIECIRYIPEYSENTCFPVNSWKNLKDIDDIASTWKKVKKHAKKWKTKNLNN